MIKQLKKRQWFWNIVGFVFKFYPDSKFRQIPEEIIIEPTNACNLRCPVCSTHFAMKRGRGFLDFELFKSIIDELKDAKVKPRISMNFSGEPLLHKEIDKFVAYASANGHNTYISTNVTMLPKELSVRLIKAGLSSIHLCMDGFSKKSQETYRVGSNFEEVKKNIEDFCQAKKELGTNNPLIIIQTLLTSLSENEMDQMKEWAERIGADSINFKTLSMGTYASPERRKKYSFLLPKKDKHRRTLSKIKRTICTVPVRQVLVYWNGDLGVCCVDFDNIIKMPNIKEKGFLKTLFSDEVVKKRKMGLNKKFGICKTCCLNDADFMGLTINFKK